MIRLFKRFKSRCPYCGSRQRYRTERPRNWKLLPIGHCYVCSNCNSHYIPICAQFSVIVEKGRLLFSACAETLSGLALAHCLGTPLALTLSVRVLPLPFGSLLLVITKCTFGIPQVQWLEKRIANFPIIGMVRSSFSSRRRTFNTRRNVRSSNANTASVSFPQILKRSAREHETI